MFRYMFSIRDINNGMLTAVKAMPQKDSTSDGTSDFEMSRMNYVRTLPAISNTASQNLQKKWMGNRDASSVIEQRRWGAVGVGSLNAANQPFSYTTFKDINTTSDALTRVRAGGAVAPPKKNAMRTNAPTPSFAPVQNKALYGIKSPVLFH